jgi:hypothetical protein
MTDLQLTSPAFSHGDEIPRKCGYKNGNSSPPLTIQMGESSDTKSLSLIMDDPDAMGAVGKVWVHWVTWNIAPAEPNGLFGVGWNTKFNGAIEGMTDFGEVGYGGPAPPDKRHTYVFKLYALDSELDLPDKSTKADVEKAMEGHIIEQAILEGTYAP